MCSVIPLAETNEQVLSAFSEMLSSELAGPEGGGRKCGRWLVSWGFGDVMITSVDLYCSSVPSCPRIVALDL